MVDYTCGSFIFALQAVVELCLCWVITVNLIGII